ncbi:hypothetical protein ACLOJK_024861 [Asimina triloba]
MTRHLGKSKENMYRLRKLHVGVEIEAEEGVTSIIILMDKATYLYLELELMVQANHPRGQECQMGQGDSQWAVVSLRHLIIHDRIDSF